MICHHIEKLNDCVFLINSKLNVIQTETEVEDIFKNTKLLSRLNRANHLCELIQGEMILFKNELIMLIKNKFILEELKNVFPNINIIKEIFDKIHLIIMERCNHQYIDDYIDHDYDNTTKITYCNICYCSNSRG